MSQFSHRRYWPYQFSILINLVTLAQTLTLPIDNCGNGQTLSITASDHKSANICAPHIPITNLSPTAPSPHRTSNLSFPPAPFLYRIPFSPYIIKYTNYGAHIAPSTAIHLLSEAQEGIIDEITQLPLHIDSVISETRVWLNEGARMTIKPIAPMRMHHSMCGLVLAGMMECGDVYGFVEADVEFSSVEDVFRPLGNGSLVLDD